MFPNIPGHVVEAVLIGWVGFDGCGAFEAIATSVLVGEFSGEDIGEPFLVGLGFGPPNVVEAFLPTARREFPLGFGRETFVGPFTVGPGVLPGHADHGVIFLTLKIGAGSGGVLPIGSRFKAPPLPFGSFSAEFNSLGRS